VFTVHGWGFYNEEYDSITPLIVNGEKFLLHLSNAIVCVSENGLRQGHQKGVLKGDSGTVIHNGIPPMSPSPDRHTLEDQLNLNTDSTIIGAITRLSPQKNPLQIVKTAESLQEDGHDVTLVLIGDGPLADECRNYVVDNGVDAYIPGFREDALDLLVDFDVFLLPSRFEGLPLTILEAMHLGIPVVAYDVGGIPEAIIDRETGYVIPEESPELFLEAVERLVENPNTRYDFGQRATERARSYFTVDRMVHEYQELYESVL
jgi:glycosyltransferase involved in cell wall biosynthesis